MTGLGEMQVHRLGEYLIAGEESFAAIVASPLQHAQRTAEIVASYPNLPVATEPDFL